MAKPNKYYLKLVLEKISNHYDVGVMSITIFKRAEISLIENIINTLNLFRGDLDRLISKKRKRRKKLFKRKDKCNLKIILEQIIDHDVGIINLPVSKKEEFCIIKNVNDASDLFSKDLDKFIKDKLIEMEKNK